MWILILLFSFIIIIKLCFQHLGWFVLFPPQTPRAAVCDCGGQSSARDVSFWRHDAGRQRSARPGASGPAEEAQLRRPDKHPVYFGKRFCSLVHTDKIFPYITITTVWHGASILGNFILKNAKIIVTKSSGKNTEANKDKKQIYTSASFVFYYLLTGNNWGSKGCHLVSFQHRQQCSFHRKTTRL